MNIYLDILLLLFTIAVIELSDCTFVSIFLGIQGLLFVYKFKLLGVESLPIFVFSVIFSPTVIYYITRRTKRNEEEPLISGFPSISLLLILVVIGYITSVFLFNLVDLRLPLTLIGVYGILTKTDLRKTSASLSILASIIHLFIIPLGIEVNSALILLFSILLLMLLYMADRLFTVKKSMSTRDLKELKF